MLVLVLLLFCVPLLQGQSVIVNEFSQGASGNQEWVELLVLTDGADIRGWQLGDLDDGYWHSLLEFKRQTTWSQLLRGTLIVVYNDAPADSSILQAGGADLDPTDGVVRVPISNADLVSDLGPWPGVGAYANSDRDDGPVLRDSSGTVLHDLASTHPSPLVPTPGAGKCKQFCGNDISQLTDDGSWTELPANQSSPGALNGGDNDHWNDSSLPVELEYFHGEVVEQGILLTWRTATEFENLGFTLQSRSPRDTIFRERASYETCPALVGQGSTVLPTDYSYLDPMNPEDPGIEYRLLSVNYFGQVDSGLVLIVQTGRNPSPLDPTRSLAAHPNPFNQEIRIQLDEDAHDLFQRVRIYGIRGNLVRELGGSTSGASGATWIWDGRDMGGIRLPGGVYLVHLTGGDKGKYTRITLLP